MKNQLSSRKFFNAMAFVALVIAGVALLISKIFFNGGGSAVGAVLNNIAYILAFAVTAFCAFLYVRTTRSLVWTLVYVIVLIIVVIPLVMSMFGV